MVDEQNKLKDDLTFTGYVREEGKVLKITVPRNVHIFFEPFDYVEVKWKYRPTAEEISNIKRKVKDDNNE